VAIPHIFWFIPQEEITEIKDSDLESLPQEKKAISYDQPTIKNMITNDPYVKDIDIFDADSDIYTDQNPDYDENYDGDPTNSLQKEVDSNYEHKTRLKRYKRIQEPISKESDEDDEPISIPTPILEQIEQEKAQRKNERLSIQSLESFSLSFDSNQ